jgi:hypothetical protein
MMRWVVTLLIGIAMVVLGTAIALRPLYTHGTITGQRWFDMVFAALFLFRGVLNVKTALLRRARATARG